MSKNHLFRHITFLNTIAFLTISPMLSGQSGFIPGYILDQNLDTLKGEINFKEWSKNPKEIVFRKNDEEPTSRHTPFTISGFGVANDIYLSTIVDIETSSRKTGELEYGSELHLTRDTVFLQTLVRGPASLFYLKDETGVDQFYIHTDIGYTLLRYKKYMHQVNGKEFIQENREFRRQLNTYLTGCPMVKDVILKTGYNNSNLQDLFSKYYSCVGQSMAFQRKKDSFKPEYAILLGVSNSQTEFEGNYLEEFDFPTSLDFSVGISHQIKLPGSQKRWSLHNDIQFTTYNTKDNFEGNLRIATVEFGFSYLKLIPKVRYTHPFKTVSTFLNIGLSNGLMMGRKNLFHEESYFHPPIDQPALDGIRGFELGLVAGIGARFQNYILELRYEWSNGVSPYVGLNNRVKRMYFLAGYAFPQKKTSK